MKRVNLMWKQKIKIAAVAGFAVTSYAGAAQAQTPVTLQVNTPTADDPARVRTDNAGVTRLRKTDEEMTNEQGVVRFAGDGTRGVYVEMRSGALNGQLPAHHMQGACTPIQLTQGADGSVALAKLPGEKFLSNNNGNEYRNFNKPEITPVNAGKNFLVTFNYQPNGTSDTRRYAMVIDENCNAVPVTRAGANNGGAAGETATQVQIMHKNGDDCDMHQSGEGPGEAVEDAPGRSHLTFWAGCNGNGRDDGWLNDISISYQNGPDGKATSAVVTKNFDISLAKREERSRGRCTTSTDDPTTAICTWTEGNNQPQRDGTWIAAVDISAAGEKGADAQSRLVWKEQVGTRQDITIPDPNNPGQTKTARTYASRMNSTRVLEMKNGALVKSDKLILYYGDLQGRNNNNDKGGQYRSFKMGVVRATRDGLEYEMPMTDVTDMMLGIDGTHLTMTGAVFGAGADLKPGFTFLQGSHNGGAASEAMVKAVGYDPVAKKFVDFGTQRAGAPYDRHMYANYLGNNPGNQGRNFAGGVLVKNPFAGQNGSNVQYFVAHALTGKPSGDAAKPELKPASYVSLMPVAGVAGANLWSARLTAESSSDSEAMGCSTTGSDKKGSALLLLATVGLMYFVRRRRD